MVEVEYHLLRASGPRPGDIRADLVALAVMRRAAHEKEGLANAHVRCPVLQCHMRAETALPLKATIIGLTDAFAN